MTRTLAAELVLDAHAELGEGPAWDPRTGHLLWVDVCAGLVHRYDPVTETDEHINVGTAVSAVLPSGATELALALRTGIAVRDADGAVGMLADLEVPGVRLNDGTVGPDGALWVGSMADPPVPGAGRLYRVASDGATETVLDLVTVSNGLAFTPDGTRLYYTDTPTLRVDLFDVDPDGVGAGRLLNRRVVVDVGQAGRPDGLAMDDTGCLWVALSGGSAVHRYTPDGRLDTVLPLPVTKVTSCAFGDDGGTLYVTTAQGPQAQPHAGGIFAVRPGCRGMPVPLFEPVPRKMSLSPGGKKPQQWASSTRSVRPSA
ncbi:SMP-30/gluconolactonase/LRE family protein [Pseudonocardia sp. NPDC046786]|uniref:SMP-30/gluconolactonase/LRE family protein n=1 Tax=Pseudonocardia sp. NPDC046786 TaxID=3155471 RepID=UPI0034111075